MCSLIDTPGRYFGVHPLSVGFPAFKSSRDDLKAGLWVRLFDDSSDDWRVSHASAADVLIFLSSTWVQARFRRHWRQYGGDSSAVGEHFRPRTAHTRI
ncbi:hypothetical protein BJD99_00535 [Rhodococcus sp. 1163]|nr:hypothetical protein BJD99_00535 [Rhodococcus sp. 1163]